jgi:predicted DNA-binding mobile mystery protein A
MKNTDIARKHLDNRLKRLKPVDEFVRPPRGWIRAIREAIGMTADQLASRLGVSQPRIIAIEKAEQHGAITMNTLSRAAEALDCTLVYALVPNSMLETQVRDRATQLAAEQLARVDHTMRLEDQEVGTEDLADERARLVAELLRGNLHRLWDNR